MEAVKNFFTFTFDMPLVVQVLCVAAATVLCLGVNVNKKKKFYVYIIDALCLAASFIAFDLLFCVIASYVRSFAGVGTSLMFLAGIALYAAFRSKHTVANRIAMASIVFSISTLMAFLGTLAGNALEQKIENFDIAVTKIVSYVLIVGAAVLFFKFPLFKFEENGYETILNIVCNILSAAVLVVYDIVYIHIPELNQVLRENFTSYMALLTMTLFLIDLATYFTTYFLCKQKQETLDYRAEAQKRKNLDELVSLSEHNLSEMREIRHDVKNQYAYMQSMLADGKYDDLKRYFEEMLGTFAKPLYEYIDSGNKDVDSILNLSLNKAAAFGVKLNAKVAVPPTLPFSRTRLLGLCSNIIDNAVDAVNREKISGAEINLEMGIKGDYLFLCVTNPTGKTFADVEANGFLPTEKKDRSSHGYGMKIIRKIVKRYNGRYHYCISDGQFVSECFLDLKYGENSSEEVTSYGD